MTFGEHQMLGFVHHAQEGLSSCHPSKEFAGTARRFRLWVFFILRDP